ncbi:MAG: MarR family transcriptional regulator [Capsulimonadaceae bacterium]|nr:MarR family transcriptional regulator [Capsulimonadaceae bacterium]
MPTHYDGPAEERSALDVMVKLMRAARSMSDWIDAAIAPTGLTDSQFGVLETLYHLGPLKPSQLADKHLTSRNNLTVIIDNLEARALVRRERDTQDRRAIHVHLTDSGRALIKQALPGFVTAIVGRISVLSEEEREVLGALLRKLGRQETFSDET